MKKVSSSLILISILFAVAGCSEKKKTESNLPHINFNEIKFRNARHLSLENFEIGQTIEKKKELNIKEKEDLIKRLFEINDKLKVFIPQESGNKTISDTSDYSSLRAFPYCFPIYDITDLSPFQEITFISEKSPFIALDSHKTGRNFTSGIGFKGYPCSSIRVEIYYNIYRILYNISESNYTPYFAGKKTNMLYRDLFFDGSGTHRVNQSITVNSIDSLFENFRQKLNEQGLKKILDAQDSPLKNSDYFLILISNADSLCILENKISDSLYRKSLTTP